MSSTASIKYSVLSDVLISNKDKNVFFKFVKKKFDLSDALFEQHRKFVNQFIINHTFRWQKKSQCRKDFFYKHYGDWLSNTFELPEITLRETVQKDFEECSVRTKKRRAEQLRQEKSPEEIELAYFDNLRETDSIGAELVKSISTASTEKKKQLLELLQGNVHLEVPYTPNQALALYVDLKCTRQKYELLHFQAKSRNSDLYPPYYKLVEAKKNCYPNGNIEISDVSVRIPLQSLLDHTTQRLIETFDASLLESIDRKNWQMICKWGMDGASGQQLYKQIFIEDDGSKSDNSVFMISMMPLRIQSAKEKLWTNPHPSSTGLCRPIFFEFRKEEEKNTIKHYQDIENEIRDLRPTIINLGEKRIRVNHNLSITMIDGKSTGYLTSTADCNCPICGATPKEMSDIHIVQSKACNEENYRFGLSSLHCWIRFFECIIHIAYKLKIQKWKVRTNEDKAEVDAAKKRIQLIFRKDKGNFLF